MRIVLINAPLKSAVCDQGVGHQMPLGLLMVGGPLLDAGYQVKLIDAARHHLQDAEIVQEVIAFAADVVLIGHVGSTSAHPCCLRVLRALKATRPQVITVYGGVHPTYHDRAILAEHPQVDVIVRGEGEETVLDLVRALARPSNKSSSPSVSGWEDDLSCVQSITWRKQGEVRRNPSRVPLQNLDAPRIGWELIEDWDLYRAFGLGRAAVVQFSRGCPHLCTYCGQWMFWKRWRHREVMRFVDEVAWLHREHGVQFFWLADENPTTLKDVWRSVLEEIVRRNLSIGWCASIRAQDIVRDADILELYKQSGCLYVLMGIETLTEESLARVRKESCIDDGYQAVRLLRRHNIMSIVDYLFGICDFVEETPQLRLHAQAGDAASSTRLIESISEQQRLQNSTLTGWLVLSDLRLGNDNGVELGRALLELAPGLHIVIYTQDPSWTLATEIFRCEYSRTKRSTPLNTGRYGRRQQGLHGYALFANIEPAYLERIAIAVVRRHETFIDPEVLNYLLKKLRGQRLTLRQEECASLVAAGLSNDEIALRMGFLNAKGGPNIGPLENLVSELYTFFAIDGAPSDPGRRVLLAHAYEAYAGLRQQ